VGITGPVLASSIHAIHRSVAHIRRGDTPFISQSPGHDGEYFGYNHAHGTIQPEQISEELNEEDFELGGAEASTVKGKAPMPMDAKIPLIQPHRGLPLRVGSMATVRVQRRAKLASKLREVFDLSDIEEVVAGSFFL
jgi:sterol 3beta-glucosyltransferase